VHTDHPPALEKTMTDVARATAAKVPPPANAEDAKLAELGYTQRLDRSVGTLASFALIAHQLHDTSCAETLYAALLPYAERILALSAQALAETGRALTGHCGVGLLEDLAASRLSQALADLARLVP